jgi:hypothetical protein
VAAQSRPHGGSEQSSGNIDRGLVAAILQGSEFNTKRRALFAIGGVDRWLPSRALLHRLRWVAYVRACRGAIAGPPDRHGTCTGLHGTRSAPPAPGGNLPRVPPEPTRTRDSLLRHRDFSPRGEFPPTPIMGRIPEAVIRYSTRRAGRSFGGAGLSSGSVRRKTRSGWSRRTRRSGGA